MKFRLVKYDGKPFSLGKYVNEICKDQDMAYWLRSDETRREFERWIKDRVLGRIENLMVYKKLDDSGN